MDATDGEARVRGLVAGGRLAEAEGVCRGLLAERPDDAGLLHQLGVIVTRLGDLRQGIDVMREAIARRGDVAEYHFNLSQPLLAMKRTTEAEASLREAIRLDPSLAGARINLGSVLAMQRRLPEAEAEFRAALMLRGSDPAIHLNLGQVCRWQQKLVEAIACFRQAIMIDGRFVGAYNVLGSALREAGRIGEAVEAFRKAVELAPQNRMVHSNLVYAMHFDPDTPAEQNFAEHLRWAAKFAEPLGKTVLPHMNGRDPERRLRVGYVSPDLRNHPIGLFMEPILKAHDRTQVEVFCYADGSAEDDLARRLRNSSDVWRVTAGMSDEQLAGLIRQDRIDVLVDLTQHMQGSRLTMFARKPSPVQITHLAYCATSGIRSMDWCMTDERMSPPGEEKKWFTEKLLRLKSYWCYSAAGRSPEVGELAAATKGYVTFGSLNSLAKVNGRVVELWRKVLQAVPDSRLMVHATMGEENIFAREMFARGGISAERLTLQPRLPRDGYLELYNGIDIGLDPFPYGGGTTSLDALWMGVPVITLCGARALSRTGVTLLAQLELEELIASNDEEYVKIAVGLAGDLGRLGRLRAGLRRRLMESPLMDEKGYTRDLEGAYRVAWREWCGR
jgi:predicted O-linked N-acetylglucosamine transferase (SPINDLY family)